jgi:hypothetical protein
LGHSAQLKAQLSSHIFDVFSEQDEAKKEGDRQSPNKSAPNGGRKFMSPLVFAADEPHELGEHLAEEDDHAKAKPGVMRTSLKSQFTGSTLGFTETSDDRGVNSSGMGAKAAAANRSTIVFGEEAAKAEPIERLSRRAAPHNQSQLQLGDNPPLLPVHTSTRVLQPPGGKSSIFFG